MKEKMYESRLMRLEGLTLDGLEAFGELFPAARQTVSCILSLRFRLSPS